MDNTFQVALIGFFILFGLIGVALFATGSLSSDSERTPVSFTVWSEWDDTTFRNLMDRSGVTGSEYISISHTTIPDDQLETRLVNALARGEGPDVLLIPHTKLLQLKDLITPIGDDFYPARQFRSNFVEGAEIFLSSDGVSAIPLAVDPLVMYWNRDIFTAAGFVSPPTTWQEVAGYAQQITETDDAGNISTAGIALGSATNISYVKEILSSLFLTIGNNITQQLPDGTYRSLLDHPDANPQATASALGLYTQFADPSTDVYSWNSSFASDRQAFVAGDLGMYLAPASEITRIRAENPNLNFDVTTLPQLEGGQERTHGMVYGFAILQRANNKMAILNALKQLTGPEMAQLIADQTDYTPVHKAVLSAGADNAYTQTFFDAAVTARGWLDPDPSATDTVFREMVRSVTSGRLDLRGALQAANTALANAFREIAAR